MIVKLKGYELIYEAWQVNEKGWTYDLESRYVNGDTPIEIGDWIVTTEGLSMFMVRNLEFLKTFERVDA